LGALVVAMVALFWPGTRDKSFSLGTQWRVIVFAALGIGVFSVVDQITGGNLSLRYQGETAGTAGGYRDKDLSVLTSRRSSLVEAEFEIFANNPIFGVGPGAGYDEREKYEGVRIASHTEVTRLLAEHGVFGLIVAVIFLFYPVVRIRRIKVPITKYYSIAFFGIAVLTSMHSAMRTTITPLFWGLGCANVLPNGHPGLRR
jgi:O-antigen ligase